MTDAARLDIRITQGFERQQGRLGPALQGLLTGVVHDFVRRYESDPKTVARAYDEIKVDLGVPGKILELDVSGKDRALAHWSAGRLTLLAVGDHDTPKRFRQSHASASSQIDRARPAPVGFWPDHEPTRGFFGNATAEEWLTYARENDEDWLYWLAPSQSAVVARVRKAFRRASKPLNQARVLVIGGPGTGKTSVLLSLLHSMTREGHRVGIEIAAQVAEQANLSDFHLEPFRVRGAYDGLDLLLVDDPGYLSSIDRAIYDSFGHTRAVVIAVDPAQMEQDCTDADLRRIERREGVSIQRLRDSYRQKHIVGTAAKRVIDRVAESSPFGNPDKVRGFRKEHRHVNDIANDIRFVNKGGAERTYREANQEDARAVIREIRQAVKWKLKSPPLLLVIDAATDADWPWDKWIKGLGVKRIELTELSSVKGLEFQWVVMVIGRQLYFELEHGFTGSSRRVYDARRLLRIPFSRARDAIYTLVVPDPRRSDGWDHFAPTESRGRWAI